MIEDVHLISGNIKNTVSESNLFMLNNLKELATIFESGKYNGNFNDLKGFRESINFNHNYFKDQVNNSMSNLLEIAERQKILKSVSVYL
jgi:hypothetical protein